MSNFNIKTWTIVIFFCCLNSVAIANPITDENLNLGTKDWVLSKDGSGHQATESVF